MPTKRRKIGARRIGGRLSERQRMILLIGSELLPCDPDDPGIEDDGHARALWEHWRDDLLADRDFNVGMPGRRPWGFWRFDARLRHRTNFGFVWPRGCRSEAETVYKHHADDAERAQIEAHWRLVPASAPPWFRRQMGA